MIFRWCLVLSSVGALGLRLHEDSSLLHLPKNYIVKWNKFHEMDVAQNRNRPLDAKSGVKLVLGVFSTAAQHDPQQVIRDTWWKQPGVCLVTEGPKETCSVYVVFVHGKQNDLSEAKDVLKLDIPEGVNNGKTHAWFQYASRKFTWATYIGKMDLDTYPFLQKLVESFGNKTGTCESFVGLPMKGGRSSCGGNHCPPPECGHPVDRNFLKFKSEREDCWSYMQGGLYIMSSRLAREASAPGSYWSNNSMGFEDLVTGRGITYYARSNGVCVDTWDPNAWFHGGFTDRIQAPAAPAY